MGPRSNALLAALAVAASAAPAVRAQAVRGVTRDATGQPVPAVIVELLDSGGRAIDRQLSDDLGAFRLNARAPGSYRVRTLRIGYQPEIIAAIVEGERTVTLTVTLASVRVVLDTITATARNPCGRLEADTAGTLFRVWEQARAALTATQLGSRDRMFGARTISFVRTLDPNGVHVRESAAAMHTGTVRQPWSSAPMGVLRRTGYVVTDRYNYTTYHAPDIGVLLSDEFLEDHCFRLAASGPPGVTGIVFEPTPGRRVPEIRGTVWLDRSSAELRAMDFSYANLAPHLSREARGRIEFERFDNGLWAIGRWFIRMPVVETLRGSVAFGPDLNLVEIQETGGALALAIKGTDTLWSARPLSLQGIVSDSARGRPVSGARIRLVEAGAEGVSDASGAFRVDAIPGRYTVEVRTAGLDSLSAVHSAEVTVTDGVERLRVRVPSASQVAATMCPRSSAGILVGSVVFDGRTSLPPDVRVVAEWDDTGALHARRWVQSRPLASGPFRLCGIPTRSAVSVRAIADSAIAEPVAVDFNGGRFAQARLTLHPGAPRAALVALVFADSAHHPLHDAEVSINALSRSAYADAQGLARLGDIPPGRHVVTVRRVGYAAVAIELDFTANETISRRVPLRRIVVLDSVNVVADRVERYMQSFADHRTVGLGKFLTRVELEELEGRSFSSILAQNSRVQIKYGKGPCAFLASSARGKRLTRPGWPNCGVQPACYAQIWVDGFKVYWGRDGEPPFNLALVQPERLEAMEYYATPAQTPGRYSDLDAVCGVLVLWTRKGP